MAKTHVVITYDKKGKKIETDCRLGIEMIPNYVDAKKDIAKLVKKKQTVGWVATKDRKVLLEYQYDIKRGYFEAHPEKKEELYKYGDVEGAPHEWTVTAYIRDKNYNNICKGKPVPIK